MTNIYSIFFVYEFICSMLPPCHVMSFYTQNSCIAKQKNPQIQSTSNPPSFFLCWCYSCMHSLSLILVYFILLLLYYILKRERKGGRTLEQHAFSRMIVLGEFLLYMTTQHNRAHLMTPIRRAFKHNHEGGKI